MSTLEIHDTKREVPIEAIQAIPNKLERDEADMLRFGKRQQMKVHLFLFLYVRYLSAHFFLA
jgi:hypothetical protein